MRSVALLCGVILLGLTGVLGNRTLEFDTSFPPENSTLEIGSRYRIYWNCTELEEISISLFSHARQQSLVLSRHVPAHDFSFDWFLTSNLIPSDGYDYSLVVVSEGTPIIFSSSSRFRIHKMASTDIVWESYPHQTAKAGQWYLLEWSSQGPLDTVTLFATGSGAPAVKVPIAEGLNNTGSYNWTVPLSVAGGCAYWLVIESTDNPLVKETTPYFEFENPNSHYLILRSPPSHIFQPTSPTKLMPDVVTTAGVSSYQLTGRPVTLFLDSAKALYLIARTNATEGISVVLFRPMDVMPGISGRFNLTVVLDEDPTIFDWAPVEVASLVPTSTPTPIPPALPGTVIYAVILAVVSLGFFPAAIAYCWYRQRRARSHETYEALPSTA
ncbi:hypothetical protein PAPYR_240 [Paratrimastix pyriformis]|uniref:Yeast cell wall synthesis Kre9/Knh1-like N-terminal domain-containing protein n=1 Tax=Paratrimastix pyriformis TaxID=342808 RepID=A0ABQ8UV76_9EUKA|nr:hypothetical protein PAPYR_240 [Paratrimastix pyriformis]